MNEGRTVCAQLLDFLPQYEFAKCVARYHGNRRVRKLPAYEQFLVLAFAQLTWRESLRDSETCLASFGPKLYHAGIRQPTARSTLADANEKRDWRVFAAFAQVLIQQATSLYADVPFDSTRWTPPPLTSASCCFRGPHFGGTRPPSNSTPGSRSKATFPPSSLSPRAAFMMSTSSTNRPGMPDRSTSWIAVISTSPAGIIPGIKVDAGTRDLAAHPGEKITEGLDGLRDRLKEYFQMGARFAKWRAVIAIGDNIPSRSCIEANAHALARYAALCQEAGMVPVVEPEVLMDGDHTLERCRAVTEEVLRTVFNQLNSQRVLLEGMILKPNMVLPGFTCPPHQEVEEAAIGEQQFPVRLTDRQTDEVADITVKSLWRTVPAAVPGIAFLSGGQSAELASARLNAMNLRFESQLPWALAFSFARAIQQPALEICQGKEANVKAAQQALLHRARCNRAARRGEYTAAMERT